MRVLMCPPEYFRIGAAQLELNPHMNQNFQPDPLISRHQFEKLCLLYQALGIKTLFLEPDAELFDQVFTANIAWGVNNTFLMANLRPEWRRKESIIAAKWLASKRFEVLWLPENIFFEGQGDIITTRDCHLYCYGIRNSFEAAEEIRKKLNLQKPIIPLRLVSANTYHGDICIKYSGLKSDRILWYPGAFDNDSNRLIENLKSPKTEVDTSFLVQELDNNRRNFPLNGIYYRDCQVFPWDDRCGEFPRKIKSWLEQAGNEVVTINFSEFGLSGAGIRCVTLFLD